MRCVCGPAGNMPPIVTEPTVIHSKVNSTVNIRIVAEDPNADPITYSLLYPRPPGVSISSGETITHTHTHAHTHTRMHAQPKKDTSLILLNKETPPPPFRPSLLPMTLLLTFVSGMMSSSALFHQMGHFRAESVDGSQRETRTNKPKSQNSFIYNLSLLYCTVVTFFLILLVFSYFDRKCSCTLL